MLSSVCDSHSDSMVLDQNRMHNVNGYHKLQRAHSYKLSKANKTQQQQQHHIACLVQNFQQNVSNERNNKHYQQFFNG